MLMCIGPAMPMGETRCWMAGVKRNGTERFASNSPAQTSRSRTVGVLKANLEECTIHMYTASQCKVLILGIYIYKCSAPIYEIRKAQSFFLLYYYPTWNDSITEEIFHYFARLIYNAQCWDLYNSCRVADVQCTRPFLLMSKVRKA